MSLDPFTSAGTLCDARGMVSRAGLPGGSVETHLDVLNDLRARTGLAPYVGEPFACTGSAHLAGEHIRCVNHEEPQPEASSVSVEAPGLRAGSSPANPGRPGALGSS